MNKSLPMLVSLGLVISLALPSMLTAKEVGSRKIVVFSSDLSEQDKDQLLNAVGGTKLKKLNLIGAETIEFLSSDAVEKLEKDHRVLRVDEDIQVEALGSKGQSHKTNHSTIDALAQVLPWGIDRVDAELVWPSGNTANPVKVGVIDTGISNKHSDLLANVKGGVNTINPRKNWNDDNGHGSHVAGIIGALDNSVGVVGVAPNVDLYAIKVLNANGSGYLSDIIEGLDWAVNNNLKVVNLSLGTSSDIQAFHDAITATKNAGITVVAAAGNSGEAVLYPAAYPEAIAVSATDNADQVTAWSSRGPEVDLAAPGSAIYSTYKGTGYATLSGTSMAAPHVAGSAALVINTPVGVYDANANGQWDPSEVQQKLQDRATDLGSVGADSLYGYGLVNAYQAVQP